MKTTDERVKELVDRLFLAFTPSQDRPSLWGILSRAFQEALLEWGQDWGRELDERVKAAVREELEACIAAVASFKDRYRDQSPRAAEMSLLCEVARTLEDRRA